MAAVVTLALASVIALSAAQAAPVNAPSLAHPPAKVITQRDLPDNVRPEVVPDAEMWRAIRKGVAGEVSIQDEKAAVLVQSEGESFRVVQNSVLPVWGGWAMLGMIVLLASFFALRGRIRLEKGFSGQTVQRFSFLERFAHWLTAISFLLSALTGLDILYGRYVLKPLVGQEAFALLAQWGKYLHDYVAFAFMLGLLMMFVAWVRYNPITRVDLKWLARGGGMFVKGSHPAAYKFNAGQKMWFWIMALGGLSLAVSGICLLFPFTFHPFAWFFAAVNLLGFDLPTGLTAVQEMQLVLIWHAAVALILITLLLFHLYIGTLGMEGAVSSMTTGKVDRNWAREHHSLWLKKMEKGAG